MLSKTSTGFSINTQSLDGISALNFSVATELMQLHEPGMPVDPMDRLAVMRSPTNTPIIFSVGSDGGVYVIFTDSTSATGWNQTDLRHGINAAFPAISASARCYTVAVSQDRNGTFRIAAALTGQGSPVFVVTRDATVPQDVTTDFWNSGLQWVERPGLDSVISPSQLGSATPTEILLSTRDDNAGSSTMIAILEVNGIAERFFVNSDFTNPTWTWVAYELTQDIQHVDDVIFGVIPLQSGGVRGTFVLGHTDTQQQALYFTSLPSNVLHQTQNLNFLFQHVPPNMTAIAALPGQIPNAPSAFGTDLYVGGDGLFVLKAADLGYFGSSAPLTPILDASAAPGVQEIIGSLGGSAISLWFTMADATDDLVVVRGTNQYSGNTWTAPVTLFQDVLQIAPLRDAQDNVEDVVLLTGGNQLQYLYQDQTTTVWTTHDIAIHNTSAIVDIQCYQVKIAVKTNASDPFVQSGSVFSISSSQWGYLTVNGNMYLSSPSHPVSVATDERGVLTITQPVSSVTAPILHVTAPFLTTGFDLHPAGVLNQQLNSKDSTALLNATYAFGGTAGSSGAQVLQGAYRNQAQVQSGAQAVQRTTSMTLQGLPSSAQPVDTTGAIYLNSTGQPVNQFDLSKLQQSSPGQPYAYGLTGNGGQWAYSAGQDALDLCRQLGQAIEWYFGDLWHHVKQLGTNPTSFFVLLAEDTLKLYAKFEEFVVEVVLFTVEQALTALAWLLQEVLGIDLSKLLQWLGFLFEFEYYQYTQQYINATISGLLGQLEGSVTDIKQYVVALLDTAESYIRSLEPLQQPAGSTTGHQAYDQYIKPIIDVGEFIFSNPVGSWIIDKFMQALNYILGDDGSSWETQLFTKIYNVWQTLLTDELQNLLSMLSSLANDLQKLVDGSLSMNQFIEQVTGDVLITVLEGLKDLIIALFDVLVDILEAVRTGFMTQGMEIPILSALYHRFTGNSLTVNLAEIVEFIAAIPATAITIFATGTPPFMQANPSPLSYSLGFKNPLPPAPQQPTANAPASLGAPGTNSGQVRASSQSGESTRPTVSSTDAWALTIIYSVGRSLDALSDVAIGVLKTKEKEPAITVVRGAQLAFKLLQIGGSVLSYQVAEEGSTVQNLKLSIIIMSTFKLLASVISFATRLHIGKEEPQPDEQKMLYGAMAVDGLMGLVSVALEIWAIKDEWGENLAADDGLLVVQQVFEYGAEVTGFVSEAFEIEGEAAIYIAAGVAVADVVAFGSNVARVIIDAEHHRNF